MRRRFDAETKEASRTSFRVRTAALELNKKRLERVFEARIDDGIGATVRQAKQVPVLINYVVEGTPGRLEKKPDDRDLELILLESMENSDCRHEVPHRTHSVHAHDA